jgi:hypothetical protein
MSQLAASETSRGPTRPQDLSVEFYEEPDAVAIHKRRGGGPSGFLALWLIGWTVGCFVVLVAVLDDPSPLMFAFAIPFWASWLLVAALLVWMWFGKETLLLRRHEALFLRTAFIRLTSRRVPRKEIRFFRECHTSFTENDEYLWGIEMVTLGKPVRFAFRLPDRERAWLIHQLNLFLDQTAPAGDSSSPATSAAALSLEKAADSPAAASLASADEDSLDDAEVLTLENTHANPPTDSRWQLIESVSQFDFEQRGRLHLGSIALLLFLNAFWNGIVSVFVLGLFGLMPFDNAPQGWEWWAMFVFLIPFEVIGLAFFAALMIGLLEPFRVTTWRFEQATIARRNRWPLFSRTRAWTVLTLDRLELRGQSDAAEPGFERFSKKNMGKSNETPFTLAFVTRENIDLCEIPELTEGEARWVARTILDRRANWFHN